MKKASGRKVNTAVVAIAGLLLFFAASCYTPETGCLDPNAANFSPGADDPCPDNCCKYPVLKLEFLHKIVRGDTSYNMVLNDSSYSVDGLQFFRFNGVQFYLSDIKLVRADQSETGTTDTVQLSIPQGNDTSLVTVENNFALVSRSSFAANTIGTFRESGIFAGVKFKIGLNPVANSSIPGINLPSGHPLALQKDTLFRNAAEGYTFAKVALFRKAADTQATTLRITGDENLRTVFIPADLEILPGYDITVQLRINYLQWFQGADLANDTETELINILTDNIPASFELIKVTLSER